MGAFSIEGIVLRHADYRENDRMLTLLTPHGRVDALSRGCKRPKSPLLPGSEVFVLGNYELVTSKNHTLVANCLLRDSFYNLRLDIDALACAAYMANICEATVQPEENAQRPFLLLAHALGYLCYNSYAPRAVLSAFLLHYAIALGYRPRLRHCVIWDCKGRMGRGGLLKKSELSWLREARDLGVKGALPAEDAPLPLLQAYLESRIDKRIPPLMTRL